MDTGAIILAGDIGGTKTKLALYESTGESLTPLRDATYPSQDYAGLEQILDDFLKGSELPASACFGIAGPVSEGRCKTTNLPWVVDERDLARHTSIAKVRLLNDLQAMALGLVKLPESDLHELNPNGQVRKGNIAVIAAGTGLGEAILYWDGQAHHAVATEGGHADFAPNSEIEIGLLRHMRNKFGGHVSYERIVSGPGLFDVYQYLREAGVAEESAEFQAALLDGGDPGQLISRFAFEEGDALCREALCLFVRIYGAEAGNLALKTMAYGGVLIGGGIAAKILPAMEAGDFMTAFCDKGRFSEWMGSLSVKIALNPDAGLLGNAYQAARLLR